MVRVQASRQGAGWVCEVRVEHRGQITNHTVAVSAAELARWGGVADRGGVEDLVARSFAFLLEREAPSSILRSFDLSVIERYFPAYDQVIRRQT